MRQVVPEILACPSIHISKVTICGYREQRARREQEKRDQKADWWEKKTDPAYTLPSPTKPHPSQVSFHSFMNYHVPTKNDNSFLIHFQTKYNITEEGKNKLEGALFFVCLAFSDIFPIAPLCLCD